MRYINLRYGDSMPNAYEYILLLHEVAHLMRTQFDQRARARYDAGAMGDSEAA